MPYEYKTDGAVIGLERITLYIFIITAALIIYLFFFSGCAGARKTAQEPLHAEQGAGITIWKIPIVGFGGWGSGGTPDIIIHQYNYQAKPQIAPTETPSSLNMPAPVDYPTIYGSAWDDPSLVIFKNESYRRVKVQIDKQKPIVLESYSATADLHLDRGEHNIRIAIEKPTAAHGIWEEIQFLTIHISPSGRSQIFHIY